MTSTSWSKCASNPRRKYVNSRKFCLKVRRKQLSAKSLGVKLSTRRLSNVSNYQRRSALPNKTKTLCQVPKRVHRKEITLMKMNTEMRKT